MCFVYICISPGNDYHRYQNLQIILFTKFGKAPSPAGAGDIAEQLLALEQFTKSMNPNKNHWNVEEVLQQKLQALKWYKEQKHKKHEESQKLNVNLSFETNAMNGHCKVGSLSPTMSCSRSVTASAQPPNLSNDNNNNNNEHSPSPRKTVSRMLGYGVTNVNPNGSNDDLAAELMNLEGGNQDDKVNNTKKKKEDKSNTTDEKNSNTNDDNKNSNDNECENDENESNANDLNSNTNVNVSTDVAMKTRKSGGTNDETNNNNSNKNSNAGIANNENRKTDLEEGELVFDEGDQDMDVIGMQPVKKQSQLVTPYKNVKNSRDGSTDVESSSGINGSSLFYQGGRSRSGIDVYNVHNEDHIHKMQVSTSHILRRPSKSKNKGMRRVGSPSKTIRKFNKGCASNGNDNLSNTNDHISSKDLNAQLNDNSEPDEYTLQCKLHGQLENTDVYDLSNDKVIIRDIRCHVPRAGPLKAPNLCTTWTYNHNKHVYDYFANYSPNSITLESTNMGVIPTDTDIRVYYRGPQQSQRPAFTVRCDRLAKCSASGEALWNAQKQNEQFPQVKIANNRQFSYLPTPRKYILVYVNYNMYLCQYLFV